MSKVSITKSKLDNLANTIAAAASTPAPLTIDQMTTAASTLVKPVGTLQITENGTGIDVAQYANVDVSVSGGDVENTPYTYEETDTPVEDDFEPSEPVIPGTIPAQEALDIIMGEG